MRINEIIQKLKNDDNDLRYLYIELQKNEIEEFEKLTELLEKSTIVKHLSVIGEGVNGEATKFVAYTLRANKSITSLDIDISRLTEREFKPITYIINKIKHLEQLTLTLKALDKKSYYSIKETNSKIFANIKDNSTLKSLTIHEAYHASLSDFIQISSLESLTLHGCKIDEIDIKNIAKSLQNNSNLEHLQVQGICGLIEYNIQKPSCNNYLHLEGKLKLEYFEHIQNIIENNHIENLTLEGYCITGENIQKLARILSKGSQPKSLSLNNITFDDIGILHFADFIESNKNISRLDLSGNHFTPRKFEIISRALAKSTSITSFIGTCTKEAIQNIEKNAKDAISDKTNNHILAINPENFKNCSSGNLAPTM